MMRIMRREDQDKEQERFGLGARKIGSQEDRKMGARKIGRWEPGR